MRGAPKINIFLYYAYTPWGLLDPDNKSIDVFDHIFIIPIIDLCVTNDPKDFVYKVCHIFRPCSLDYWY